MTPGSTTPTEGTAMSERTDATLFDPVLNPALSIWAPWRLALGRHPLATVRTILAGHASIDALYFAVNNVRPNYKARPQTKADYVLRHLGVPRSALGALDAPTAEAIEAPSSSQASLLCPPVRRARSSCFYRSPAPAA